MIYSNSSLNKFFDGFYKEIIYAKKLAVDAREHTVDTIRDQIFNKLSAYIQTTSSSFLVDYGDFIEANLQEVIYLMTALADETMLNFNWLGQGKWTECLLEEKFFGTHKAGEEVFNRIDKFLTNRNPLLTEIAEVYIKVLALGFKGRYRSGNQNMIVSYRKKLYRFITQNDVEGANNKIFFQGYNFTLSALPARYFPNHNAWDYMFYSFLTIFCLGTSVFWEMETDTISRLLNSINKAIS